MNHSEMPALWTLLEDAESAADFNELIAYNGSLGVRNVHALYEAEHALSNVRRAFTDDITLPSDFIIPILAMPGSGFAPDYFSSDIFLFCSRHFRDALVQPASVVQYVVITLLSGGSEVRAQDYRWMRVIAQQPAMDLQRSECKIRERVNRFTGATYERAGLVERCILLDNLQPKTEIFRIEESPTDILVTDALALRVLQAGCTGMEFADPGNPRRASDHRHRTATGIGTYRYGY